MAWRPGKSPVPSCGKLTQRGMRTDLSRAAGEVKRSGFHPIARPERSVRRLAVLGKVSVICPHPAPGPAGSCPRHRPAGSAAERSPHPGLRPGKPRRRRPPPPGPPPASVPGVRRETAPQATLSPQRGPAVPQANGHPDSRRGLARTRLRTPIWYLYHNQNAARPAAAGPPVLAQFWRGMDRRARLCYPPRHVRH